MKDPIKLLDEKFNEDSLQKVQSIYMGPTRFILVFDPDLALEVLLDKNNIYTQNRDIFNRIKPITGDYGLVQLNGSQSLKTRQSILPMFAPANMALMKDQILENTAEALEELKLKGCTQLDIVVFMADLVLRNAFKLFLGLDIKHEAKNMADEFRELNILCGERMISLFPLPLFIPSLKNKRIKYLRSSLRSKISKALKGQKPENINIHKLFLNDDTLIDQCMTFLFAGHETTASSLAFTFILLGKNPEYRQRIVNGEEGLALMVYKEALRLYPPAYMLAREAKKESELGNVRIKKGDQVIIGVKQIHHHPNFHHEPANFKPDRFMNPTKAFLPFGAGPKSCIGEGLAYLEALTIIKSFCHSFEFSSNASEIFSFPLVTLHPAAGQYLSLKEVSHG